MDFPNQALPQYLDPFSALYLNREYTNITYYMRPLLRDKLDKWHYRILGENQFGPICDLYDETEDIHDLTTFKKYILLFILSKKSQFYLNEHFVKLLLKY